MGTGDMGDGGWEWEWQQQDVVEDSFGVENLESSGDGMPHDHFDNLNST